LTGARARERGGYIPTNWGGKKERSRKGFANFASRRGGAGTRKLDLKEVPRGCRIVQGGGGGGWSWGEKNYTVDGKGEG